MFSRSSTKQYSELPKDGVDPQPLTLLQQEACNSVFGHKRNYSPLQQHSYNPKSIKQGAIRSTSKSKTPSGSKKVVNISEVSKQTCPSGISPDFDVVSNGKRIKLVPFLRYLYDTRNTYCKNKTYPNFVWDATIDKYCCSENPEDILTRLNHLLDALENGVGNVNVNSSNSPKFDLIKSEINKIFKFLFPDDTGFDLKTNKRNLAIRQKVEEKLDSLIFENDTGEPTRTLISPEFKRLFDNYVTQMERDKTLPDISDPEKAEEVAVKIETIASNEYSAKYKKMPTETMKANYIRDVLAALPEYYKQPVLPKDSFSPFTPTPTTKKTANAKWARYGGRQHHLKKKYKSKSKPKSKSNSKVNTKNTRRIRRKW
jgi:hypothetical protein